MSITYKTLLGDTFETISRRRYGHEGGADNIRRANPGVVEPLPGGAVVVIPPLPGTPGDLVPASEAASENEISVIVNGVVFRHWTRISVVRSVDTLDTAGFAAPFSVDTPGFKETFRPLSYKPFGIDIGGRRLFTGTLVGVNPEMSADQKMVRASGYSVPGVLQDCTAPAEAYPLEFGGWNLREIAEELLRPFGIPVVFDSALDPNVVFDFGVGLKPGKKILPFLIKLAKEKNLLVSNTPEGELLFRQADVGAGVRAYLRQGEFPLLEVTPAFDPQEYYSSITGIEQVFYGFGGGVYTKSNPRLAGVVRPFVFEPDDSVSSAEISTTVEAKMGRMLANAAPYTIKVATWRTPDGALWEPGDAISVYAPDAMIYEPYKFVIRQVTLDRSVQGEYAILNLVPPGSLAGKVPEVLPWDA